MAKGTITFEFESLPDLQRQMWAALGPMSLMADAAAKDLCPQPVQTNATRPFPAGTVYYSDGREPTHIPTTQATPFEPTKAQVDEAGEIAKETADAIRTASGIDAAGRQAVKEALKDMVGATPTPEQNTPAITLETLANAPYPELLAFCKNNPGVGLDVSKCPHEYFRKMVEIRIKTFLETK